MGSIEDQQHESREPNVQPMRTSSHRALPPPDAAPPPPTPHPTHSSSSLPQPGIVTLGQGRSGPRATNEYVDSPRSHPVIPLKPSHHPHHHQHHHLGLSSSPLLPTLGGVPSTPVLPGVHHAVNLPCRNNNHHHQRSGVGGGLNSNGVESSGGGVGGGVVVSTQPSKIAPPPPPLPLLKKKDEAAVGGVSEGGVGGEKGDGGHSSIICAQCGKCRCRLCSEPRELPVRWCCGDRCELSARKVLDVCTCFCCVQTLFYHGCGGAGEEDNAYYDDPCACGGRKCCSRWACLSACSLVLPCLWCYCPLKACLASTRACYNCCRQKGCQCSRHHHPTPPSDKTPSQSHFSQTRRLLMESESSSSSA
ncbi:hypothetical protein ACOMHN_037298 [Nucella lapillus]